MSCKLINATYVRWLLNPTSLKPYMNRVILVTVMTRVIQSKPILGYVIQLEFVQVGIQYNWKIIDRKNNII